jgi:catechol 2,3-dioxygenase-like lactoylglutathione lyase family enzyme
MIEGISAVTLGTHEMPRAVRFYRALGFEVLVCTENLSSGVVVVKSAKDGV